MDLREALTRQSLLLEFISECVILQSVPELARFILKRLHWICEYETCTSLMPDMRGLTIWSENRKEGPAKKIDNDVCLSRHRTALDDAMAKGSPTVTYYGDTDIFLAALPLGSNSVTHGALCVARKGSKFSQSDIRHLQHACSAVGGALARMAALVGEREAEHNMKLVESELRSLAEDRVLLAEQMVGIVSHDLRNPLSAILMGTELIGKDGLASAKKDRLLQNVQNSARRAQRLVEDLLDFTQARVGSGLTLHLSEVNLSELLTSIFDELQLAFPNTELDKPMIPLGSAYLDSDRIHQAVGNLIANAATYGAPGTSVRLKCEVNAGKVIFSICNEGEPIPHASLEGMFDPMVRGEHNQNGHRGVGLGLYIVRAIAKSHHGTVDVTSSREHGTCFSVHLPLDCRSE